MKEKINARIAEIGIWGELADHLDYMENSVRADVDNLTNEIKERYPDGGDEVTRSWQYADLQRAKTRLKAFESVRTMILKVMG